MDRRRRPRRAVPLLAAALVPAAAAWAGDVAKYRRTVVRYELPQVTLVNQDGSQVKLPQALTSDKPLVVNFIFSTCTTVCPVLSAGVSTLMKDLGPERRDVRVVSIAIDPDHDTPEVLHGYRQRFGAGPEWELLTGSREDIDRTLRAFDAYTPNKVAHRPLTYLRAPGSDSWVRIDGLISAADLMAEYRALGRH